MAIIDTERDVVVIRIVYDGPPAAGKTTSIHALRNILAKDNQVISPAVSPEGRTLYFDWLDYVGGFFHGRAIACQIISVPAQPDLQAQRHFLLQSADAVVFVLDAHDKNVETAWHYFEQLKTIHHQAQETFKIVIQANKQDLGNTIAANEIEKQFIVDAGLKTVETSAIEGNGIRQAFVLAVRAAIERCERLMHQGKLPTGKPEVNDAQALLTLMQQQVEMDTANHSVTQAEPKSMQPHASDTSDITSSTTDSTHLPPLPDERTPNSWLWPPLMGKEILTQPALQSLRPEKTEKGYQALNEQWRCYSLADWQYAAETEVRTAFRQQIAWHLQLSPILSEQRYLAITQTDKKWHLWQITNQMPNLSDLLQQALQAESPKLVIELFRCASRYLEAYQGFSKFNVNVNLTLNNIGVTDQAILVYLGEVLSNPMNLPPLDAEMIKEKIRQIFTPPISQAIQEHAIVISEVLEEFEKIQAFDDNIPVVDALIEIFVAAELEADLKQ